MTETQNASKMTVRTFTDNRPLRDTKPASHDSKLLHSQSSDFERLPQFLALAKSRKPLEPKIQNANIEMSTPDRLSKHAGCFVNSFRKEYGSTLSGRGNIVIKDLLQISQHCAAQKERSDVRREENKDTNLMYSLSDQQAND